MIQSENSEGCVQTAVGAERCNYNAVGVRKTVRLVCLTECAFMRTSSNCT